MGQKKSARRKLLDFDTICAATQGDPDALAEVLRHFDGFITKNSMRLYYDEYGQAHRCIDPILRSRIENKLVKRVVERFRVR